MKDGAVYALGSLMVTASVVAMIVFLMATT